MVVGIDIFKKYFEQYPDNYIIIGGTACDIIIGEAGFTPRATKDIDIIVSYEYDDDSIEFLENLENSDFFS